MFKKILIILLSFLLLITVVGCDRVAKDNADDIVGTSISDNADKITIDSFASAPFSEVAEGDPSLSDGDMKALIAKVPSDKYESYPETHGVPVSATLYKNGEAVSIDPGDERLISLVNFFNNCVYYSKCAYTQGLLPIEYIDEKVTDSDFRLELKYTPYGDKGPSPYGSCTTRCDTIVITTDFTLIAHDLPGYEGESETYPFCAVGYSPLYGDYSWLELFGF